MPLRIIAAAIGELLGFAIWYIVVASLGLTSDRDSGDVFYSGGMSLCVIGGGALVQLAGEKIGLIPTQERVNKKEGPPSILSRDDD